MDQEALTLLPLQGVRSTAPVSLVEAGAVFVVPTFYRGVMPPPGEHIIDQYGRARVVAPTRCPNGHELRPPNVSVGYTHCGCRDIGGGHLGWACRTCGWEILAADHVGENPVPPQRTARPSK